MKSSQSTISMLTQSMDAPVQVFHPITSSPHYYSHEGCVLIVKDEDFDHFF